MDIKAELITVNGHWHDIADVASISHGKELSKRPWELLQKLYKWGHMEPFEFVSFVWKLEIPIFLERQLLRHRISSKVEQSMRYVKLNPSVDDTWIPEELEGSKQDVFKDAYYSAFEAYERLLKAGVPKEQARAVLPLGFKTKMFVSFNARSFDNFLRLRLNKHAQKEMRELAYKMLETLMHDPGSVRLYALYAKRYLEKGGFQNDR